MPPYLLLEDRVQEVRYVKRSLNGVFCTAEDMDGRPRFQNWQPDSVRDTRAAAERHLAARLCERVGRRGSR